MPRKRLTQSKLDKAVKAVAAICGAAPQVVIEPDGTIRVVPVTVTTDPRFDRKAPVDL
jgi:hypothetical protein